MVEAQLTSAIYDTFSCVGGSCPYTCCRDWNAILIDDAAMQKYRGMPDILSCIDQSLQCFRLREQDNCCFFLNQEGLCDLVLRYGDRILCKTCASFPRLGTLRAGIKEIPLSNGCPEVLRLLDHTACPLPFTFTGDVFPEAYLSDQSVKIRDCMIDILQTSGLPLYVKLQLLYMFAQRLATGEAEHVVKSFSEPVLITTLAARISDLPYRPESIMPKLHELLNAFAEKCRKRMPYREYLEPFCNQIMEIDRDRFEEKRVMLHSIFLEKAGLLENISVNYAFRHFAQTVPEHLLENLICLALELSLSAYTLLLRLLSGKDITENDIYVIFSFFARVIEHNEESMQTYTRRLLTELGFAASDFYLIVQFLQCANEEPAVGSVIQP